MCVCALLVDREHDVAIGNYNFPNYIVEMSKLCFCVLYETMKLIAKKWYASKSRSRGQSVKPTQAHSSDLHLASSVCVRPKNAFQIALVDAPAKHNIPQRLLASQQLTV